MKKLFIQRSLPIFIYIYSCTNNCMYIFLTSVNKLKYFKTFQPFFLSEIKTK